MLIVEMGIIAPFLWILWTAARLYYSWKIVRRLRGTRPISDCRCDFLVCLLVALSGHVWWSVVVPELHLQCFFLDLGGLFRLPDLLVSGQKPAVTAEHGSLRGESSFDDGALRSHLHVTSRRSWAGVSCGTEACDRKCAA